jgi:PLP dependent protein
MTIQKNLQTIQANIKAVADRPVAVVAVTKNRETDEIRQALESGIAHIGENRLQEAKEKMDNVPMGITKHFIGHLQTNKVKDVIQRFDVIQSVDSLKLARKIDHECQKIGKVMPILIQVNTSGETQKSGVIPSQAITLIRQAAELPNLRIKGLMTLAIQSDDKKRVYYCFNTLKQLFDEIDLFKTPNTTMKWLSMGMSNDYELAVKAGANMIRIGRKLFE